MPFSRLNWKCQPILLLSFVLVLAMTSGTFADTVYWNGSVSDDWSIAGNWDIGVPTSADEVRAGTSAQAGQVCTYL